MNLSTFNGTFFNGTGRIGAIVLVPQVVTQSLPEAIVTHAYSIAELIDLLPGGLTFGTPDEEADDHPPYATFAWIGETTISYVTTRKLTGQIGGPVKAGKRTVFQMTLVGLDYDELDEIYDVWESYFNPSMKPLTIRNRLFRSLFNQDPEVDFGDSPSSPSGRNTVVLRWQFEVITNTR